MPKDWINLAFGILIFLLFTQCSSDPNADVKDIELDIEFIRVDSLMYEAAKDLKENPKLDMMEVYQTHLISEKDYLGEWIDIRRYVPPAQLNGPQADTFIAKNVIPLLADSAIFILLDTVREVFPYDYPFKEKITPPLKRLVKYIPDIQIPPFRGHVNGYIPNADMRGVDQILFLDGEPGYFSFGLHYFMGGKFPYYPINIPQYQKNRFSEEYMEVLMVESIANGLLPQETPSQQPTLLDRMVQAGIKQYFMQQILPNTPDSLRLKYTADQMDWADLYEARIYKELIDNLFDTNFLAHRDFIMDKPYTTSLSQESAPRLGEYLGWKIVTNYMEKNSDVSLSELLEMTNYEEIFQKSRYKPEVR